MLTFLLLLIIIACVLLVIIILAQNPKGGGLTNIGAGATQFFGARQTADFLEKATWYFGIGIFAIVVISYFLTASPGGESGAQFKVEESTYTPTMEQPLPEGQNLDFNAIQPETEQPAQTPATPEEE